MLLSPEYTRVESSWRVAIPRSLYQEAMTKFDQGLPFDNLFGEGVSRVVIPHENQTKRQIHDAVTKLGYARIDWAKGEVIKVIPPHPKAPRLPDGSPPPPKEQRTSLGKVLARLPEESKDLLDWYSANLDATKKADDYSIVISRHPVDVVRMSDHRNINTSCHAQEGSRWQSCLGEMAHGGLVAYMVKAEDLQELGEKIPGKDEIFYDEQRSVHGIIPLSRLRVRRYTHKDGSFDLAVPELKLYGQKNDDFRESVDDWVRKVQEPLIGQQRWRMDDFVRRGGKYPDNPDGRLFNSFFGDKLETDYKYADFGIEGEEEQYGEDDLTGADPDWRDPDEEDEEEFDDEDEDALQEERNEAIREDMEYLDRRWNRRLIHCRVSYEEGDAEYGEEIDFSWVGSMEVDLPGSLITENGHAGLQNDAVLNGAANSLKDHLSDQGFDLDDGEMEVSNYGETVQFSIHFEGGGGSPNAYERFCSDISSDWDDNVDEIKKHIIGWLTAQGFTQTTPVREFSYADAQFQNFEVYFDEGSMEAVAEAPLGLADPAVQSLTLLHYEVEPAIRDLVSQELAKIIQWRKYPTGYLPGFQPETPVETKENYDLSNFTLKLTKTESYHPQIMLEIWFEASDLTTAEDMAEVVELMRVVDQLFPRIVNESMRLLEGYFKGVREQNKRRQEEEALHRENVLMAMEENQ